jgi:predicted DNA binding CopG/RHH family protein
LKDEYDFSELKRVPNPYAKKIRRQITIRIDEATIEYFKKQAAITGIPYQNLINLYLAECAAESKTLKVSWK